MSRRLREITAAFVVAPPSGARVRTRLKVAGADAAVLRAVGTHLGSLAAKDLAERCRKGRLSAKEKADSRREQKRALTAASSSRWAGAITRTSEDAFGPALAISWPSAGASRPASPGYAGGSRSRWPSAMGGSVGMPPRPSATKSSAGSRSSLTA